jgi:predicted DNA-binding antitoxin AbrB/MazE fold protein
MIANIKATYSNGVLTPVEPLELEDGEEVTLHVENGVSQDQCPDKSGEKSQAAPNPASLNELFDKLRESVPDEAFDDFPTDMAKNYKHYLYGWPKEDE